MVERQEVEALLALVEAEKGRWSPHVPAPTLAALCRTWLAVQEAPVMQIGGADGLSAFLINHGESSPRDLQGQRVRIVKEVGDD